MANVLRRRAIIVRPLGLDDDEPPLHFQLADMPVDPLDDTAWVTVYDYDRATQAWKPEDDWFERNVRSALILEVTLRAATNTIAPLSQLAQLDKLVKLADAHTVLVLEPGMVRVRDATVVTLCPLVLRYNTAQGAPIAHEDILTDLADVIAYQKGGEPTVETRGYAAQVAEARRKRKDTGAVGMGGGFGTPQQTPRASQQRPPSLLPPPPPPPPAKPHSKRAALQLHVPPPPSSPQQHRTHVPPLLQDYDPLADSEDSEVDNEYDGTSVP